MMTRDEHLAWCKQRAHEYLDIGDVQQAVQSMMSDVQKHDEIKLNGELMALGLSVILSNDRDQARRYIDGFV